MVVAVTHLRDQKDERKISLKMTERYSVMRECGMRML